MGTKLYRVSVIALLGGILAVQVLVAARPPEPGVDLRPVVQGLADVQSTIFGQLEDVQCRLDRWEPRTAEPFIDPCDR